MEALLYSFFAGTSTVLGVVALFIIKKPGNKLLSTLLGFAGGIMMAISLFELIPEAIALGSMTSAVVGVVLGAAMMAIRHHCSPFPHVR